MGQMAMVVVVVDFQEAVDFVGVVEAFLLEVVEVGEEEEVIPVAVVVGVDFLVEEVVDFVVEEDISFNDGFHDKV
jgi:hypothetical protein